MITIPKQTRSFSEFDVVTGRPMASLATDVDLGKGRAIAVSGDIKVFLITSTMASRTGRVPVLSGPRPVQRIGRVNFL